VIFGREGGASAGSAVFGEAVTFLQPGYAHTLEEKRREEISREVLGDGAPALVDLEAGVIRLPAPVVPS